MAAWGNRARRNPAHRLLGRKLAVRSHPAVDGVQGRLSELGYAPGQYVIDGRYADGDDELLPRLAADLVSDKPDVIFTVGPQAASAAAQATSKIPIIFVGVGDPVGTGLVPNLSRPPGNVTRITLLAVELAAKRLDLLKTAVPGAARIAIVWNPRSHSARRQSRRSPGASADQIRNGLNLETAKTLGFEVPPSLLVRDDEVIE